MAKSFHREVLTSLLNALPDGAIVSAASRLLKEQEFDSVLWLIEDGQLHAHSSTRSTRPGQDGNELVNVETLLFQSVESRNFEIVQALLKNCDDLNHLSYIETETEQGQTKTTAETAVGRAIRIGFMSAAQALEQAGAALLRFEELSIWASALRKPSCLQNFTEIFQARHGRKPLPSEIALIRMPTAYGATPTMLRFLAEQGEEHDSLRTLSQTAHGRLRATMESFVSFVEAFDQLRLPRPRISETYETESLRNLIQSHAQLDASELVALLKPKEPRQPGIGRF